MFSIAMATYNGEKHLGEQLRSLAEQTLLPSELVICDDTSSDHTVDIIKRFSEPSPFPVKLVVNEERLGWRKNFLKAASLCASEYIAFCDQDDVWLPEKLAVAETYLNKNQCTLLQHGYRLIDDSGNIISGDLNYNDLARDAPWRHSYGLNQIFHRSLLDFFDLWGLSEDHFVADQRMAHDQFVCFLSTLVGGIVSVNNVLLYYRQHRNNAIGFVSTNRHGGIASTLLGNFNRIFNRDAASEKREITLWTLKRRIAAADARRKITEKIISRLPKDRAHELLPKLRYYEEHVKYQSARLLAYESPDRGQRLAAMLSALGRGQYTNEGRRGARDAGLDLVYGVMG